MIGAACPRCGLKIDVGVEVGGPVGVHLETPENSVTLCINCGEYLVPAGKGVFAVLEEEALLELPFETLMQLLRMEEAQRVFAFRRTGTRYLIHPPKRAEGET